MSGDHNMNQTSPGWRKRQIALDKNYEVHSCSPFCDKPLCVAEAVQAEREACAKVCEKHGYDHYCGNVTDKIAETIRARGQTSCTHEWIDDTKTKPTWRCAKCNVEYVKEQL